MKAAIAVRPTAIVVDRFTAATVAEAIEALGGGWWDTFQVWQRISDAPYLVMLAHTNKRVRQRAPLTYMVATEHALRTTMHSAFGFLSNVECQWVLCVVPGSEGDAVVREFLLMDSKVGGAA